MSDPGERLRRELERALDKNRPKDVIVALQRLEQLEPSEARWPHRLGDALRKASRTAEAESAYVRAMNVFAAQGFIARAVALAKVVVEINPKRADLLASIDQRPARDLRTRGQAELGPAFRAPPPLEVPSPAPVVSPIAGPAPVPRADLPPVPLSLLQDLQRQVSAPAAAPVAVPAQASFVAGIPRTGIAAAAIPLCAAEDAQRDEVRFTDLPELASCEIDVSDIDAMLFSDLAEAEPSADHLSAQREAMLSACALFADISPEALGKLAAASHLVELNEGDAVFRNGDAADALFVVVDGAVRVVLAWMPSGGIDLAAGQVFGEVALLDGGKRQADCLAVGNVVLLRIDTSSLRAIAAEHTELHELLFDVLVRRLVANHLQTSPLFAAFDRSTLRQVARLFEVRRVDAGVVLVETGKRSDGLYLALVGEFELHDDTSISRLPLGTWFGHGSLLQGSMSGRTVRTGSEAIVLRMPAARFGTFAAQFPPALAHLMDTELGGDML